MKNSENREKKVTIFIYSLYHSFYLSIFLSLSDDEHCLPNNKVDQRWKQLNDGPMKMISNTTVGERKKETETMMKR
jgi:hypothetical protein